MKPVKFEGQNLTFAENQKEYLPLPAFKAPTPQGEVITCWEFESKEEEERFLTTGKLYLRQLTFGGNLQPVSISSYEMPEVKPTVTIFGIDNASDLKPMFIYEENLKLAAKIIYEKHKGEAGYYDYLKFLWVKYPDDRKDARLINVVPME